MARPIRVPAAHDRLEPQVQAVLDGITDLPAAVMNSRYDGVRGDVAGHPEPGVRHQPAVVVVRDALLLQHVRQPRPGGAADGRDVGEVSLSVVSFGVLATPETRMTVYTTVDEESRERLDWLIAHPDAPPVDPAHKHTA